MGCNARKNSEYSGYEKEIPQMMLLTVQIKYEWPACKRL